MSRLQPIAEKDLLDGLSVSYIKLAGIWDMVNTYRTSRKITLNFRVTWYIALLLGVPFSLCQFACPAYISVDMEKATLIVLNLVSIFQMIVKPAVFLQNIETHSVLFTTMKKDLLSSIPEHKRAHANKIYSRIARRCNFLCYFCVIVTFSTASMWIFMPGIRSEYILYHVGNMKEVTTGPRKILGAWYPVPFDKSPWTEIIYAYEFAVLFCCAVLVSLYEVTLTMEVLMLHAHLSVLNFHITTLKKDEIVFYSGKRVVTEQEAQKLLFEKLLAIIRDHQKLLKLGQMLKECYIIYITVLVVDGGLILITSVFQFLFGAKDIWVTIQFMLYVTYEVTEFSLLCFTTTMMETSSTNIGFSIYSSEWYTSDKKLRNTAQMVMIRSQRPLSLVAGKMYPVNVETLMSIFQFTYSASTLMSRTINKG